MRLATIATTEGPRLFVKGRSGYIDAGKATNNPLYSCLQSVLDQGYVALDALGKLMVQNGRKYPEAAFGPAVPSPNRILCLGINYSEHAIEWGRGVPTWPESFIRATGTVLGPFEDLVKPALSSCFDYEGELGIVIGQGGRYIKREDAFDAIAGYVVINDASARDWQRANTQWTGGKNFEGSMPIGPEVVTTDEVDISDLQLTTTLNGKVVQSTSTSQMIVDVPSAIEFFSSFTRLRPGDVIATGTPSGVGLGRVPPLWLESGDMIEVSIENIGTIRNMVVEEKGAPDHWRWKPQAIETVSLE